MAYGQLSGNYGATDQAQQPIRPSVALERLEILSQKIGVLVMKLNPIFTDKPEKPMGVSPIQNSLLNAIDRNIEAIVRLTDSIEI